MRILDVIYLVKRLGLRRVALNGMHRIRLRSGWYVKKVPIEPWSSSPLRQSQSSKSPFSAPEILSPILTNAETELAIKSAERVLAGDICYFSYNWRPRPITWKSNPISGYRTSDVHWSQIPDFYSPQGDIKWIWEPSRFDWVYQLGRAWVIAGDVRFANGFWSLVEDWRENNTPNLGINWKCGQECSFRLFALVWASGVFALAQSSTLERQDILWETVEKLAERIEASIDYALSQNNNHGLSEAAALYISGVCMPMHPSSLRWRKLGLSLFLRQVDEQFSDDGTYVQNSFNYTRLAMRVCAMVISVARSAGDVLPSDIQAKLQQGVTLLYQDRKSVV